MGKAPEPFYDPLTFAVDQAHRRGLELHARFNPFRVRPPILKGGPAPNYIPRVHPEWICHYGSQLWLDPGLKAVRDYATQIILDVVKRYDIDGVHRDDYFYPYPEKKWTGQLLDFPDDGSWQGYLAHGGRLSRPDWRRKNVDDFVENLNHRIKAEKRWVKLGISPFGIWKLGSPPQVTKGLDAYEHLYADSRRWLTSGWVDYFVPQLYWGMDNADLSFSALLPWWANQNPSRGCFAPAMTSPKSAPNGPPPRSFNKSDSPANNTASQACPLERFYIAQKRRPPDGYAGTLHLSSTRAHSRRAVVG